MEKLLASAKRNLEEVIAFFGLVEEQRLSQYLFEQTFKLKFAREFVQKQKTVASKILKNAKLANDDPPPLTKLDLDSIKKYNEYDVKLYEFAKDLFKKRIRYFREIECENNNVSDCNLS